MKKIALALASLTLVSSTAFASHDKYGVSKVTIINTSDKTVSVKASGDGAMSIFHKHDEMKVHGHELKDMRVFGRLPVELRISYKDDNGSYQLFTDCGGTFDGGKHADDLGNHYTAYIGKKPHTNKMVCLPYPLHLAI